MEEERREREEVKRREEQERAEAEKQERDKVAEEMRETIRMEWRRWARKTLVTPEADGRVGTIRIAIRLPGGEGRSVRQFSPDDTLTSLYAYVDSHFIPSEMPPSSDPVAPPSGILVGEAGIESQIHSHSPAEEKEGNRAVAWWGFKLVLAYPRRELVWAPHTTLESIEGLKGGAQIVVEKIRNGKSREPERERTGPRSAGTVSPTSSEDEDGYDTESD